MDALRRLHINVEWFLLRCVTLLDSHRPGWIVMCEHADTVGADEYRPDWHALSGGDEFGMDHNTGRFRRRVDACLFSQYRNATALTGEHYYVAHAVTHPELPENYA